MSSIWERGSGLAVVRRGYMRPRAQLACTRQAPKTARRSFDRLSGASGKLTERAGGLELSWYKLAGP